MKPRPIYFLHWNDRKAFLCDFPRKEALISRLEEENFQGCYGTPPETEDLEQFRRVCKVKIELAVRDWFNEKKALIHLALGAGIFLFSFYFLSYVIRDPLPLVDELLLSTFLGGLGWFRLSRQEVRSEEALIKKQELNGYADRIPFAPGEYLKQTELHLERIAGLGKEERETLIREEEPLFFTGYSREMLDLRRALGARLKEKRRKASFPLEGEEELRILYAQLNRFLKK